MKALFGGKNGFSDYAQDSNIIIDFLVLIQHKKEGILLISNLYSIESGLELIIEYFRYRDINKDDVELLEQINKLYQKSFWTGRIIKKDLNKLLRIVDVGEKLRTENIFDQIGRKEFLVHWRKMIREIIEKQGVAIVGIMDFGSGYTSFDSLLGYSFWSEKAEKAYEELRDSKKSL
jgi:hypothetical protein